MIVDNKIIRYSVFCCGHFFSLRLCKIIKSRDLDDIILQNIISIIKENDPEGAELMFYLIHVT